MIHAADVGEHEWRFHVVVAQAVLEEERVVDEQAEDGHQAAQGPRQPAAEREDIEEGHTAADHVPDAHAELVVRQQPELDRRGDNPEFERGLFEKGVALEGAERRVEPIAGRQDAIYGVGVDGLVILHVRPAEADEQRERENGNYDRQPERPAQSFTHVTRDQIRGTFTFSIETGASADCARNAERSRSALNPM